MSSEQLYFRRSKELAERISEKLCEYPREELDQCLTTFNFPETKIFIEKGYTFKRMCNLLAYYLIRFSSGIAKNGGWDNKNCKNGQSGMDELLQTIPTLTFSSQQFYWKHLVDLIEIKDIVVSGTTNDFELPICIHKTLRNNFINTLVSFLIVGYNQLVHDTLKWFESASDLFSSRETFVKVGERVLKKKERYFDNTGNFDVTKIDTFSNDLQFGSGYSHIPNLDLLKTIKKNMDIEKSTSQEYQDYQDNNNSDDELLFEEEFVL